ncbi:MAG: hypothetical protein II007_11790 [Gammaproteobacteria bacterium]|nr:hypothetical protein [Gammaproteobacteria bacterium]
MVDRGRFQLQLSGNLLVLTAAGRLTRPLMEQLMADVRTLIAPLAGTSWGSLLDLSDWGPLQPDLVPLVQELNRWCCDQGMAAEAVVISGALPHAASWRDGDAERAPTRYFHTQSDARNWLASQQIGVGG